MAITRWPQTVAAVSGGIAQGHGRCFLRAPRRKQCAPPPRQRCAGASTARSGERLEVAVVALVAILLADQYKLRELRDAA